MGRGRVDEQCFPWAGARVGSINDVCHGWEETGVKLISNVCHGRELEWDVLATYLSSPLQPSLLILQIRKPRPGERI